MSLSSQKKLFKFNDHFGWPQSPNQTHLILPAKAITEIPTRSTPPSMGGISQMISPEEFKNRFGIAWQEGMEGTAWAYYHDARTNLASSLSEEELTLQVSALLETPATNMELCKIDDTVGYGVFARSFIPKGSVLCIYSGSIRPLNLHETSNYALQYYQSHLAIIPEHFRGIASFFQHLPNPLPARNRDPEGYAACLQELLQVSGQNISIEDLKQTNELLCMEFQDEQILNQIATANLTLEYLIYKDVPLVVMVTNRAVMSGEHLGFNYGYKYWLSRNQNPSYFNTYGQIIPTTCYRRIYGSVDIDGFIYTGEFQQLINALHDSSSSYITLTTKEAKKQISKATLEMALYKTAALSGDELNYARFKAKEASFFSLAEHQANVDEFLAVLTQTSLAFNQEHCNNKDTTQGYWRFSELEQSNNALPTEYKSGFLNSEYFVKQNDFCFEKKSHVSSWDACKSLTKEGSFGVITDNLWGAICHLLALQEYLSKPVFEALFPQLTLSDTLHYTALFSATTKYNKSHGGLLKYINTPDYKFRHPYSPYASLSCLNLPTGLLCFGVQQVLDQLEMKAWLEEQYYKEQTATELDYIQKVSANKLLEYPTPKDRFKTEKCDLGSSRASLYALLHSTQNQYDLDALINVALKDTFHLLELEFCSFNLHKEEVTINAFGYKFGWYFSFIDGKLAPEESYVCPLKDRNDLFGYSMMSRNRIEHTSSRYSYGKRKPLILSEETLTVCTSIISFFTNANHFEHSKTTTKAFELIQKLRHQLLEIKINNQLQQEEAPKPIVKEPQSEREPNPSLVVFGAFFNTMTLLEKKESCTKKKIRLSSELGLPEETTVDDVRQQKKTLFKFWHPDRNRSIIATEMCQKFTETAGELIEAIEELPRIQAQLDAIKL